MASRPRWQPGQTLVFGAQSGPYTPPTLDVVDFFGCDPAGVVDCSTLLTAAFVALANTGIAPFFPAGTFLVGTLPTIPTGLQPALVSVSTSFTGAAGSQLAEILGASGGGSGAAPGTPGYNPSWYAATDIYWDPQNGSDTASGTAVGSPVKTWAEIVRRYGSASPVMNYGQSVTVHQLTGQSAGVDPVFFEPKLSGGGSAILLVSLVVAQAAFVGGTRTAQNRTAGGALETIAAMPAGTVKNQLVFDSTIGGGTGAYAFIDSMSGTTATMQQWYTAASLTGGGIPTLATASYTTGDTLTIYNTQLTNLKRWAPEGGDLSGSALSTSGVGSVQFAQIADSSGVNGSSVYLHYGNGAANILAGCLVDSRLHVAAVTGRVPTYVIGCSVVGAVVHQFGGGNSINGGGMAAGFTSNGGNPTLDQVALHGAVNVFDGILQISNTFGDGTWIAQPGGTIQLRSTGLLWGSYTINVAAAGTCWNNSGHTWATWSLTSGAYQLGGATTGSSYTDTAGTGSWADAISITNANLDTNTGLQNPKTGARFCNIT